MRWIWVTAVIVGSVLWIAGCTVGEPTTTTGGDTEGADTAKEEPCKEQFEFNFVQYHWKGDFNKRYSTRPANGEAQSFSALLYSQGWIDAKQPFGGAFDVYRKREGFSVGWKVGSKLVMQHLYAYFFEKGFFDLPGSEFPDDRKMKDPDYATKIMVVQREDVRHIVCLEDVMGDGTDPRWGTFNDCVKEYLGVYSNVQDVHASVEKSSFSRALSEYLKEK